MKYLANILEAIGRTPLVRLNKVTDGASCLVLAKVEAQNPGNSVKDRPSLFMIEEAERRGLLRPGATIVEPTSGNTGIGLAQAAAVKGYRCIFVMPDKMSEDKVRLLQAYGAEVVITPTNVEASDPRSYYSVADRLTAELPHAFQPNQFKNLDNPEAHYRTTGPEIWEDTAGRVTHLVGAMGTGGTVSGTARYLKERNPGLVVVGADPEGSVYSGDEPKPYHVEGIGMSCVPATADLGVVDRFERVSDRESFAMARRLTREEGIFSGGSCGTAVVAAARVARSLPAESVVVVILPSGGRSYVSKLYSDAWMQDHHFIEGAQSGKLNDLLRQKSLLQPIIQVGPSEPVQRAANLLRQFNISQLPVMVGEELVGSIGEGDVLRMALENVDLQKTLVRDVMGRPFPMLSADVDVSDACYTLAEGDGTVVVVADRRPVGVLTRIDFIHYLTEQAAR
ncbi:MAG: pyridoxal-phosphate dependent enzyme [Candidatus Sericytochromatia bacterium]|nr:pyridoxal-phosphate dependent enzyme [Candidatus Sericytochromatia bacterium]